MALFTTLFAAASCIVIEGAQIPRTDLRSSLGADGRPVLSGPEVIHDSADGRYRVHYTLSGGDALASVEDVDPANGVPDTVDWVEAGSERTYQFFVVQDGWPGIVPDEGIGGSDRLDIYLRTLDANGYTHVQVLPSTAKGSWVEVDPARISFGKVTFQSIAGHEMHHVLQFAVTDQLPAWIYEATATYAQYLEFSDDPVMMVAGEVLWQLRLSGAAQAMAATGNRFEYAGMIWIKFLVDRGGGARGNLLHLWNAMAAAHDWVQGHNAALPAHFGIAGLDVAAAEFAVWNWFACNNDDGHHYDPANLVCGTNAAVTATAVNTFPSSGASGTIGAWGSGYLQGIPDCKGGDLTLTLRPTGAMRFSVIDVVGTGVSPVSTQDGVAGVDSTIVVRSFNQWHRVVVAATNVSSAGASFTWSAATTGTYSPPATLPTPTRLEIAPAALALSEGEQRPVVARATFGTCEDGRDLAASVTWTTSDASVVVVAGGVASARGVGEADVFATVDGVTSNRVHITVTSGGGCAISAPSGGRRGAPIALLSLPFLALCVKKSRR